MKLDVISNTKKGIFFGLIYRVIGLFLPFIIQSIIIRKLGIEYIGVKGLFSSILTVLNLAELGFGNAIVYEMYRPIAEDDTATLCSLVNLYRKVYFRIGLMILGLGLLFVPFLHYFIKGEPPEELNIELVFLLYLIDTVISYWVYAYKSSILYAYQRMDIYSAILAVSLLLSSALKIFVLVVSGNYYLYLGVSIIFSLLNNIIVSLVVDKSFPCIKCKGEVKAEIVRGINKRVAGLLIGKVCGTTRNTFDSIFLSVFLGLTQTAIYSNYYVVINTLNGIMIVVLNSLLGGVGNNIVLESKAKNYHDMIILNNIYLIVSGTISVCMLCLYQPFMRIWIGDDYLFSDGIMMLFPIYFYIMKMGDIRGVYSDGAGLFWENRWRFILEAIANIILNFILGWFFGALGILVATIFSLFFIGFLGSTRVIFKYYFPDGKKKYYKNQFVIATYTAFIGFLIFNICKVVEWNDLFVNLVMRGIICIVATPLLYWFFLHRTIDYKEAKRIFYEKIIKKKIE